MLLTLKMSPLSFPSLLTLARLEHLLFVSTCSSYVDLSFCLFAVRGGTRTTLQHLQVDYMRGVIRAVSDKTNAILESPTGPIVVNIIIVL